jgi:hypothetical protein
MLFNFSEKSLLLRKTVVDDILLKPLGLSESRTVFTNIFMKKVLWGL